MSSLLDLLKDQTSPEVIRGLASSLGESTDSVQQGLQTGSAAMLTTLASKAQDEGFLGQIMNLVSNFASRRTMGAAAGAGAGTSATGTTPPAGSSFLNMLFSGSNLSAIQGKIAEVSGMRSSSAVTILASAAPMVLSALSSKINTEGLTASGLGSTLTAELPRLSSLLPSGFSIPGLSSVLPQASQVGEKVWPKVTRWKFSKRGIKIAGIAIAAVLVILILLPLFVNINRFRPKIESEASAALGRQVTVGNLSLSILSGSVGAEDIAIADDPAFSKAPFMTAKSLKVGVELLPLIFSKQLNVTDIKLEAPQITLLKTSSGKWNFSSIGGASAQKAQESAKSGGSAPTNFSIAKLSVKHGKLLVGKVNSSKPAVYDDVNVSVKNFSFTSEFPFQVRAKLPGSGDVNISGKAGPINAEDNAKTPLATTVKVNNMNIVALGIIDPASGIAGLANYDGTLNSDGSRAKAVGLFTGKQLKFSPKGSPAPKTVAIKHAVDFDLDKQSGSIFQGDIAIGAAQAHLTGTFLIRGESEVVNLKLNAPNMPVDELEPMLPSIGVALPSGSQLKGGTLSVELAITGPVDKPIITGPVRLANTELANFDLGSKLGALSAFAGKSVSSRDTSIQNASLDARVAPEGTKADNINLNVPAIGVITGAGTVSPEGALAFKMVADLHGGVAGGLSKVAGTGSGQGGIPFAIEGTTTDPKFIPDVGGVVGGVAKGQIANVAKGEVPVAGNVTKGVGGLLKRK